MNVFRLAMVLGAFAVASVAAMANIISKGHPAGADYEALLPSTQVENQNLSGTRVEAAVMLRYDQVLEVPTWQSMEFKVEWLHSGSAETLYYRSPILFECEPFVFRYATTRVDDGQDLKFRVTGFVRASQFSDWVWVDENFVFKAYNKIQHLGTPVKSNGEENMVFESASTKLFNASSNHLSQSHSSNPSSAAGALSETYASIVAKIAPSTVMAALSHGSLEGFDDSLSTTEITFSDEVASNMNAKGTTIPQYNLVALWSCHTLNDLPNASESVTAYNIVSSNQCYLGFPSVVSAAVFTRDEWNVGHATEPVVLPPPTHDLGDHASVFFTKIGDSAKAGDALIDANEAYVCVFVDLSINPPEYGEVKMELRGDPRARLKYVYFTQPEWTHFFTHPHNSNVYWSVLPVIE